jgi:hypothetical protein
LKVIRANLFAARHSVQLPQSVFVELDAFRRYQN